jgi:hypothetical protein
MIVEPRRGTSYGAAPNAAQTPPSNRPHNLRRVRRTATSKSRGSARPSSSGTPSGLLRRKVSTPRVAKTPLKHRWRKGIEQGCARPGCRWYRMERIWIDPVRPRGYVYRHGKNDFWDTYDRVPLCGSGEP